jgi:hypothetical protein
MKLTKEEWMATIKRSFEEHPLTTYETRRLIAHIDALEAELAAARTEIEKLSVTIMYEGMHDREKAAIAAARLEEAEWWYPRTVTCGLGWQDEDGRQRIKALGGSGADRPEPANGTPPATKEGART